MSVPAAAGIHLAIKVCRTITNYRTEIAGFHAAGESVGLLPTIGGLHAGHMALVEQAKAGNDRVVTKIFVNPIQFGDAALALANFPEEDFNECIKWGHLSYQRQSGLQLTMIAGHEAAGDLPSALRHYELLHSIAPRFFENVVDGSMQCCRLEEHSEALRGGLRRVAEAAASA